MCLERTGAYPGAEEFIPIRPVCPPDGARRRGRKGKGRKGKGGKGKGGKEGRKGGREGGSEGGRKEGSENGSVEKVVSFYSEMGPDPLRETV